MLVEAKLLLQNKVVIVRQWQAEQSLEERRGEDEEKTVSDFSLETIGQIACCPETSQGPELWIDIIAKDSDRFDLRDETRHEAILGLGPAICLIHVLDDHDHHNNHHVLSSKEKTEKTEETNLRLVVRLLIDFIFQLLGSSCTLQHLVLTVG